MSTPLSPEEIEWLAKLVEVLRGQPDTLFIGTVTGIFKEGSSGVIYNITNINSPN